MEFLSVIITKDIHCLGPALIAEITSKQQEEMVLFDCTHPWIPEIGKEVPIAHYSARLGGGGDWTSRPIEHSQIRFHSNNFGLDNYHGMGVVSIPVPGLSRAGEGIEIVLRRPRPSMSAGVIWQEPWNLSLEVSISADNGAYIRYFSGGENYLEVYSAREYLPDSFATNVIRDDTGLFQIPSEKVLQERIAMAESEAGKVGSNELMCLPDPQNMPSRWALVAASNIASRLGRRGEIYEEPFFDIYRRAWNLELQKELPGRLRWMREGIAGELLSSNFFDWRGFTKTPGETLVVITQLLASGEITLEPDSIKILGQVIALNQRLEEADYRARAVEARENIERTQREIEELRGKLTEYRRALPKINREVRAARKQAKRRTVEMMRMLGIGDEEGRRLIANARPERFVKIKDEIPF